MSKNNKNSKGDDPDAIIIRLWPKTPILYPMAFLALICGIVGEFLEVPAELISQTSAQVENIQPDTAAEPVSEEPAAQPELETTTQPATETDDAAATPSTTPMEVVGGPVEEATNIERRSRDGLISTILAMLFLAMFAFSLFVVCIDFEVRWSMLGFVLLLGLIMSILVLDKLGHITLPSAISVLNRFTLFATPLFYYCVFVIWLLLMIVSAVIARLHYVKIEHNEVVEYGGVMETQKRMSTFRMHWSKEIKDVFEYWLPFVRSGTLIFSFPNEEKPLILNNVININRVLKKLDAKSSSFQVKGME